MTRQPVQGSTQRGWRDALAVVGLILLFAGAAAAFVAPWRHLTPPGSPDLRRYVPWRDGDAALAVLYDATGQVTGWQSANLGAVPSLNIFTELPVAPRRVIDQRYFANATAGQDAEDLLAALADVGVAEVNLQTLRRDGTTASQRAIVLRDATGQYLVYAEDAANELALTYDPPAQVLPATLQPGVTWQSQGRVNGALDYTVAGRVAESSAHASDPDCATVETHTTISGQGVNVDYTVTETYCAGRGLVESRTDAANGVQERAQLASAAHLSPDPALLPPAGDPPPAAEPSAAGNWPQPLAGAVLQRFARALPPGFAGGGTTPPVWLPTDPPRLLAAAYNGDLIAYSADGSPAWRFHPGGAVHARPGVDLSTGRIYVGASDKQVTALDRSGLYLWSFATGDNVATRPLAAGDVVIFGSEDRTIYGLDKATGALRWRVTTGAAVTSSPAALGDVVAIGSDDGVVYGLDAASGDLRWTFVTGGAVEAEVVAADGHFFVASRDGTLSALDPNRGEPAWSATASLGDSAALRTAPAVAAGQAFVVDTGGLLYAVDAQTGQRRWQTDELGAYVGPPLAVQDGVVVARHDGAVDLLNFRGSPVQRWDANDLRLAEEPPVMFALGPSQGGEAVWLVDNNAVIYRLAPQGAGLAPPVADEGAR